MLQNLKAVDSGITIKLSIVAKFGVHATLRIGG
jgi:hypothetical protein